VRRAFPYLILLIAVSLVSLFFRLGDLPLSGADEPRYARIAQEMHEQGIWITPKLEGKPWLEKPPLYYWITKPFFSMFQNHETAARFGPALCAFASAMAIFWAGSLIWTRTAGLMGSLILLSSLGFAGFGRGASTDMPFACCFTLAMASLAVASKRDIGRKVLFAYIFLGLAVLAKGPVAAILAAGIGLFAWLLDERRVLLRRWHILPGFLIMLAVAVPWFWLVMRQNGYSFLATFFINHNLARYITNIHHHSEPVYYFIPVLAALAFPWSGWLLLLLPKSPLAALRNWRQWNPGMVLLSCWCLFPIIFFSMSESKLAGYILPSLPPLALILGVRFSRWAEGAIKPPLPRFVASVQILISTAMAFAAPFYFQKQYGGHWKTGLLLSIILWIPALFAFMFGLKGNGRRAFAATVLQGIFLIFAIVQFAFPVLGTYHSTRNIAQQAMEQQKAGEPIITYRFFHHSLHYYTHYRIAGKMDDPESLMRFADAHSGFLAITDIDGLKALYGSEGLSIDLLGKQGNFRLLRISRR
jgi:4-amino-4-deoxy-L-arabinose transferase-like glycosyltransferase